MKLTNKAGLHPLVVRAIEAQMHAHPTRESEGAFASVTTLLKPPMQVVLQERHFDELEEEAEGRIWALYGSAMHHVLDIGSGDARTEERMAFCFDGEKITGGFDAIVDGDWLSDYKLTSVWSVIYDDRKKEWAAQINMYVYGLASIGTHIKRATIETFFRDWSAAEAKRAGDYPQRQWARIEIPIWPRERTEALLRERIRLLREARALADEDLVECTYAERWEKPTKYAVMKCGGKRAVKLHSTAFGAEGHMEQLNSADTKGKKRAWYRIEKRPGERIRCERYCSAAQVCLAHADVLIARLAREERL